MKPNLTLAEKIADTFDRHSNSPTLFLVPRSEYCASMQVVDSVGGGGACP